ncbi:phospho-sugar mutase [Plantibacter flavus]|uniref:phospho-sugar mutase n=1 Tax=Plantibacter flavus TaxID=150123 RepID=UPI003F18B223
MSVPPTAAAVLDHAEAWLAQDPDPQTAAQLEALVEHARTDGASLERLTDLFAGRLQFGTAGLRGALGPGPMRMNRVLVAQTAAGLADVLLQTSGQPSIVIGFDARTNSRVFAEDTARIMTGAGVRTTLLPRELPTPVLAFAVRHLHTSAGVMVTASHNPAQDNGYKVYLGGIDGGAQIVAPQDTEIAEAIERAARRPIGDHPRSSQYTIADESVVDAYVRATAALGVPTSRSTRFVYTALHGVGWETARSVFVSAGFGEPISVVSQQEPDPAFPTVEYPNPEEPGALDRAIETADATDAALIIANDPDADRLAVAIPTRPGWRRLSGNEIGMLLGWRIAARFAARSSTGASGGVLAASLVSSPALAQIAGCFGLRAVETLTGFKHISRVPDLVFGFEEALGYLVDPEVVHDKDGISAAVEFLSLVAELRDNGSSIEGQLVAIAEQIGGFASEQVSLRVDAVAEIDLLMASLRQQQPMRVGDEPVRATDDFMEGEEGASTTDMIRYTLESGSRVIVRPSGTEPKLKAYVDVRDLSASSGAERLARAARRARQLATDVEALLVDRRHVAPSTTAR